MSVKGVLEAKHSRLNQLKDLAWVGPSHVQFCSAVNLHELAVSYIAALQMCADAEALKIQLKQQIENHMLELGQKAVLTTGGAVIQLVGLERVQHDLEKLPKAVKDRITTKTLYSDLRVSTPPVA